MIKDKLKKLNKLGLEITDEENCLVLKPTDEIDIHILEKYRKNKQTIEDIFYKFTDLYVKYHFPIYFREIIKKIDYIKKHNKQEVLKLEELKNKQIKDIKNKEIEFKIFSLGDIYIFRFTLKKQNDNIYIDCESFLCFLLIEFKNKTIIFDEVNPTIKTLNKDTILLEDMYVYELINEYVNGFNDYTNVNNFNDYTHVHEDILSFYEFYNSLIFYYEIHTCKTFPLEDDSIWITKTIDERKSKGKSIRKFYRPSVYEATPKQLLRSMELNLNKILILLKE